MAIKIFCWTNVSQLESSGVQNRFFTFSAGQIFRGYSKTCLCVSNISVSKDGGGGGGRAVV